MVYDIMRDSDSMGGVCSQVYFRFSCAGCVRGRYSDTLISSILFLMVRLIVISLLVSCKYDIYLLIGRADLKFLFFKLFSPQQPRIALSYLEWFINYSSALFKLICPKYFGIDINRKSKST